MLRRILTVVVLAVMVSVAASAWFWWHMQPSAKGEAYVGLNDSPLWDGAGPVRRLVAQLPWGAKVTILNRYDDSTEVRTAEGKVGWVKSDELIDPNVWERVGSFASRVRGMTTQAKGHTRVLSNLRLDPGRNSPRIGQLRPNTPVEILKRGVAARNGGSGGTEQKRDWLLLRARTESGGQVAGWALGDFIQEDPPDPLAAYATSSGVAPVAWFELRKVTDPHMGAKPYYLLAGSSAAEGSPCDFTRVSVYTWSLQKEQYETSFTQGNLCGRLPIEVKFETDPQQDVAFSFSNFERGGVTTLSYFMRNTLVRPLRAGAR